MNYLAAFAAGVAATLLLPKLYYVIIFAMRDRR